MKKENKTTKRIQRTPKNIHKANTAKSTQKVCNAAKKTSQKAVGTKVNSKPQTTAKKPTPQGKQTAKTTGKSSTKQKNSVTKAVSAKQKSVTTHKAATDNQKTVVKAQKATSDLVTVEIRVHNDAKGGHPHIMIGTVEKKNVSVGTTHDKYKGKGHRNIPLDINPLGKAEPSYMHRQGTVDDDKNYQTNKRKGKMSITDHNKATQIGERAKQKYLNNKKGKE